MLTSARIITSSITINFPTLTTLALRFCSTMATSQSIVNFRHGFDRLFDDFFGRDFGSLVPRLPGDLTAAMSPLTASAARCDLIEKPDHFEVTAEVPGFKKEEVSVEVSNGVLKITAEHNEEHKDEGEKDGWKYHRMERSSGSLHRSIKLPASADVDRVTASADSGVLTINIAKKPEAVAATPKKVPVA